ncbi:MAG: two-component system response regulator [Terricaulis sp.]
MEVSNLCVAVVTPNRFDGRIIVELLRDAGVISARLFTDSEAAFAKAACERTDVIIIAMEAAPMDGLAWVRALRRERDARSRKAPVFLLARNLTAPIAESCRRAGANAVIGMPVSNATVLNTIRKVLDKPRPFVEGEAYVGPCRRAGIVVAGAGSRRRRSDTASAAR